MGILIRMNDTSLNNFFEVNDASINNITDVNDIYITSIVSSESILNLDNQGTDSDDASINVTPNTMDCSVGKIDTGDGTGWFWITSGTSESGDFNLEIINFGTMPTENVGAQILIEDISSGLADDLTININFSYFT